MLLEATCSFVFLSSMADTSVKGHAFLARLSRVAYWRSIVRLAWRSRSMRFSRGVFRCLPASASLPRLLSRSRAVCADVSFSYRLAQNRRFCATAPCTIVAFLDCSAQNPRLEPSEGVRLASQSCKTVKSVQPHRFSRSHLPAPTRLLRQKKRPEPKLGPII